jgi:hypothetical protein
VVVLSASKEGMKPMKRLGWLIPLVMVGACGGGGGDPAAEECEALFSLVCDRFLECGVAGVTSHGQCMDEVEANLPGGGCDDADAVGPTYAQCTTTLETISCADLVPGGTPALPTECNGVILIE